MHSAWLERDGSWSRTQNVNEVLDHQGRMIVCDDKNDEETIAERVAAETGKYAIRQYSSVVLSEVPVFNDLCDEAERLVKSGQIVQIASHDWRFWTSVKIGTESFLFHSGDAYHEGAGKIHGLVLREGRSLRVLSYDPKLWERAARAKRREDRRREASILINKCGMERIADELSINMGLKATKSFRVEQFVVWLFAHDQFHGRRATNKIVRNFAKNWLAQREGNKKHYRKWIAVEVIERLDARLRAAVRQRKTAKG